MSKRVFDLVAATLLLILFFPVMLLAALAVLICDKFRGPVLYRQDRVGRRGTKIQVLKFRTMQVDAEETGAVWAAHDDPRMTRIGRLLRRTHMDELPQLFSVLRGNMSMVGPAPRTT